MSILIQDFTSYVRVNDERYLKGVLTYSIKNNQVRIFEPITGRVIVDYTPFLDFRNENGGLIGDSYDSMDTALVIKLLFA